jgi:ABC-type Fe3+ transport system permease subunit
VAAGALAAVLAVSMGTPLLLLISELPSLSDAARARGGGLGAIGNSLLVSAGSAALALAVAWPASAVVASRSRPALIALATLLLVPQCVPASAYGIAWVEMSSARGLPMDALGWLGPTLCLAARLGGPACLFLAAARLALPAEMLEAARIQEGRSLHRGLWIAAPQLVPPAVAAAGILLALSLNAVGILVLTVPPGFEVLPLRADNLLHYGLPEEAIALAIATAVLATAPALLLVGAARLLRSRSL